MNTGYILDLPSSIQLDMPTDGNKPSAKVLTHAIYEIWGGKHKTPKLPANKSVLDMDFICKKSVSSVEQFIVKHVSGDDYTFTCRGKTYRAKMFKMETVDEVYRCRGLPSQVTNMGRFTHVLRVFEEGEEEEEEEKKQAVHGLCNSTRKATTFRERMERNGISEDMLERAVEELSRTASQLKAHRQDDTNVNPLVFRRESPEPVPDWIVEEQQRQQEQLNRSGDLTIERGEYAFQTTVVAKHGRINSEKNGSNAE